MEPRGGLVSPLQSSTERRVASRSCQSCGHAAARRSPLPFAPCVCKRLEDVRSVLLRLVLAAVRRSPVAEAGFWTPRRTASRSPYRSPCPHAQGQEMLIRCCCACPWLLYAVLLLRKSCCQNHVRRQLGCLSHRYVPGSNSRDCQTFFTHCMSLGPRFESAWLTKFSFTNAHVHAHRSTRAGACASKAVQGLCCRHRCP